MSDQTPETSESQGNEPSMEDILSSIRQMIDADDIGVNVPIAEESSTDESLEPTALVTAVEDDDAGSQAEPVNPFDILESLTEDDSPDDLEIPEISADEAEVSPDAEAIQVEDVIELEIEPALEEDEGVDLVLADDEVLVLDEILELEETQTGSHSDYAEADDLGSDMDLVIDDEDENLLELASDDEGLAVNVLNENGDKATTHVLSEANVTGDADIDLVKSLMADLTDDDMMDDVEADIVDAHLDMDETETELPSSSAFLAIARQASAEADAVEHRRRSEQPLHITPDPTPEPPRQHTPTPQTVSAELDETAIAQAEDDLEIWVVEVEDEAEAEAEAEAPTDTAAADVDFGTGVITEHLAEDISEIVEQETQDMARAAAETIIDNETETEASSAFANLAQVVQQQEEGAYMGPHIGELVTEAMKPMLKEWLDKNLKGIVERAVTKEVKRISGGK